ncbi:TIGR02186 family protein [Candidatus Puniceispirillum marinum]|uniref:Transmembrane protein n=1 Tax=Puniceispirillum marinum (strain IMCC1322) TaxID=488538 RepID=D5BNY7_PUNMI|nr:TIGR02186 family protein [Candidatus Puniceispirillum marinum]ADE40421.1 hypothetical protein SAR116_2178 [Candidatus Puniceispirillum marinum IMCC1322]
MIRPYPHNYKIPSQMTFMLWLFTILSVSFGTISAHAVNGKLVADLSENTVSIESDFHGTELLLFGAVDGMQGDDIIIVVRGPDAHIAQRRKSKVAGIWINVETNIWTKTPSFYQILATRDLAKIANEATLQDLGVGATNLALQITPEKDPQETGLAMPTVNGMVGELVANMRALGLWGATTDTIALKEGALFRSVIDLPSNVHSGQYEVRIIHLRDGVPLSEDTTSIAIRKGGLSATIYNMAHEFSFFYGLFAVIFAIASGWLAAAAFRKK